MRSISFSCQGRACHASNVMRRDFARSRSKTATCASREFRVVDVEVRLVVQPERAHVEVRRADRDQQSVDDHDLAVEHRRLVLVDLRTRCEKRAPTRARGRRTTSVSMIGPGRIMRTLTPRFMRVDQRVRA